MHSINGNKAPRLALKVGHWNCNKGLLNSQNFPTDNVDEIAQFITSYDLDILTVSESNLHGVKSRVMRANPVTIHCINNVLRIHGYHIVLPESWHKYQTARILLYVRDSITMTNITTNVDTNDLVNYNHQSKEEQRNAYCYSCLLQ